MWKNILLCLCSLFIATPMCQSMDQRCCHTSEHYCNFLLQKIKNLKNEWQIYKNYCQRLIMQGFLTFDKGFYKITNPTNSERSFAIIKLNKDKDRSYEWLTSCLAYLCDMQDSFVPSLPWQTDGINGTLQPYIEVEEGCGLKASSLCSRPDDIPFIKIIDAICAEMVTYHQDACCANLFIRHHDKTIVHIDNEHCLWPLHISTNLQFLKNALSSLRCQRGEFNVLISALLADNRTFASLTADHVAHISRILENVTNVVHALQSSQLLQRELGTDPRILVSLADRVERMNCSFARLSSAGRFSLLDFVADAFPDFRLYKYIQIAAHLSQNNEINSFAQCRYRYVNFICHIMGEIGVDFTDLATLLEIISELEEAYDIKIAKFVLENCDLKVSEFCDKLLVFFRTHCC